MQCETITGWYDNTCDFDTATSSSTPERQPKKEGTMREKENENEKVNEDGTRREKRCGRCDESLAWQPYTRKWF